MVKSVTNKHTPMRESVRRICQEIKLAQVEYAVAVNREDLGLKNCPTVIWHPFRPSMNLVGGFTKLSVCISPLLNRLRPVRHIRSHIYKSLYWGSEDACYRPFLLHGLCYWPFSETGLLLSAFPASWALLPAFLLPVFYYQPFLPHGLYYRPFRFQPFLPHGFC